MPDTNLNLETATLSQLNSAVQTLIAGLKEAGSTARAVFPPDSAGMFDSSVMSPAQLAKARDLNRAKETDALDRHRFLVRTERAAMADLRKSEREAERTAKQAAAAQSRWEAKMNIKATRFEGAEHERKVKAAYKAGLAWERQDKDARMRAAKADYDEKKFVSDMHLWAADRLDKKRQRNHGEDTGTGNSMGAVLGRIPKGFREQWKMGRQVLNMSQGLSSNPVSNYNDARDIFEYAQNISAGLGKSVSAAGHKLSYTARSMSTMPKALAGTAGRALQLLGSANVPMGAAGPIIAAAAAIPIVYGAAVKLDTIVAENYARSYEAGSKYARHKNSMADLHGEGVRAQMDQARNEIRESMIQVERAQNASAIHAGTVGAVLRVATLGFFDPSKSIGFKSNLELSNSWLAGNGSAPSAVRAWLNVGASLVNKVVGTNAQFLSQSEIDEVLNARTEKISTKYFEMKDQADKAALDGDVSMRFKIDQSLVGEAPTFYKNLTTMTSARGIGLAYRLAHQAKVQQDQFAFIFDDWKRPRDF